MHAGWQGKVVISLQTFQHIPLFFSEWENDGRQGKEQALSRSAY
jgi:hypothetical protein